MNQSSSNCGDQVQPTSITIEPIEPIDRMRFEAAVAAMQGILASGNFNTHEFHYTAEEAVKAADELIKELQKTKP